MQEPAGNLTLKLAKGCNSPVKILEMAFAIVRWPIERESELDSPVGIHIRLRCRGSSVGVESGFRNRRARG